MHKEQRVDDMAGEVLTRQARNRAERTGTTSEEVLDTGPETEAGRQEGRSRDDPHTDESRQRPQDDLSWQQEEALTAERNRVQNEERRLAKQEAARRARIDAWESFMQTEQRGLELRKDGQLAGLLGEPQPGESPMALQRLALADQRQAEQGLVTLMSGGKTFYKHVSELSEEDMPARRAAERLRTTWLKERRDGWLGRGGDYQ